MRNVKNIIAAISLLAASGLSHALTADSTKVSVAGIDSAGNATVGVTSGATVASDCFLGAMSIAATTDNGRALYSSFLTAKLGNSTVTVSYTKLSAGICRADAIMIK